MKRSRLNLAAVLAPALCMLSPLPVYAQGAAPPAEPVVIDVTLSESRELEKNFIRVILLASVTGPDLKRLSDELGSIVETVRIVEDPSSSTSLILGARRASVDSARLANASAGLFWTVSQEVTVQGLAHDRVLDAIPQALDGLSISSIDYSVPADVQKTAEIELSSLVLGALQTRAEALKTVLGGAEAEIDRVEIETTTDGALPASAPPPLEERASLAASTATATDPGTGAAPPAQQQPMTMRITATLVGRIEVR